MKYLIILLVTIAIGAVVYYAYYQYRYSYSYEANDFNGGFDAFYADKLAKSKALNVRPGNEEKLIRFSEGKTPIAFLYIHGFSASRTEGEYVVDSLANKYKANTYYLRLPGHGTNQDDHAAASYVDYLNEAEEAIRMMQDLGDRVVVIATSMGGMLGTYLAATYPDMVDGLILASPFYDYTHVAGAALKLPGVINLVNLVDGPQRPVEYDKSFNERVQPGYFDYWYKEQKYMALQSLEELRRFISGQKLYEKVQCPVLMLYYYKDKDNQDEAASVDAMLKAYNAFSSPNKTKVAIADGTHVLMSAYMQTDKASILNACSKFIEMAK